jgi:AraC family transcriptional regulator
MVTTPAIQPYHARLQRVLAYIDAHLDEPLSVEVLSGVAAFSPWHFHRQFTALFGIGVHRYVQLARLKRASYRLAFRGDASVIEIALDSGYEAPEAFSRAFRQRVGQTPSAFRKQPRWAPWHAAFQPVGDIRMMHMMQDFAGQVRIVEVPDRRVALLEHRGDPALILESVGRFIAWRKMVGLPPRISATFNIWYDDPGSTPADRFRMGLAAATERDIVPNEAGITASVIPGGRCATLRHTGSDDTLRAATDYLYAVWLPESGEEPRDFPPYCQRITFGPDVPEHEIVTDIYLPLK